MAIRLQPVQRGCYVGGLVEACTLVDMCMQCDRKQGACNADIMSLNARWESSAQHVRLCRTDSMGCACGERHPGCHVLCL